jgi:epoxide hydrolase 4
LWGEADTALPPRLLDGLSELVDDLTIERLPGATHWLAHEEPERIAASIQAYCGAS